MIKRTRVHWDAEGWGNNDPVAIAELAEAPEGNYSRLPNPNEEDENGNPKHPVMVRLIKPTGPGPFRRPPFAEGPDIEYETYGRKKVCHVSTHPNTGQRIACTYWVWVPA